MRQSCCTALLDCSHPPVLQVAAVCDELLGMQELKDGFVAVGFSQVGLCMTWEIWLGMGRLWD